MKWLVLAMLVVVLALIWIPRIVWWHGAIKPTGDAATDTLNIQTALDYGGEVRLTRFNRYFWPTPYVIDKTLQIRGDVIIKNDNKAGEGI